jgi:hypothetical protein
MNGKFTMQSREKFFVGESPFSDVVGYKTLDKNGFFE